MKDFKSLNIYQNILDQESLMFTGRVNILYKKNSQMVGSLTFYEGEISSCHYRDKVNLNALILIFFDESKFSSLKYLVEPEILERSMQDTRIKFTDILPEVEKKYKNMWDSCNLRPKDDLIFLLNGDFVIGGPEITKDEFTLMKTIVDFNQVSQIYLNSNFNENFITMVLVDLRKKGALKVIKYK